MRAGQWGLRGTIFFVAAFGVLVRLKSKDAGMKYFQWKEPYGY
ncbi:hypothetical protein HMPREF3198_00896 [Winkia neuii]|nr:hypothetical protein HMPREF3198_00896 [Winkia neuii]